MTSTFLLFLDKQYAQHLNFPVFLFALNWIGQVIEDMSFQTNVPALAMEEVRSYSFLKVLFPLLWLINYLRCIILSMGRLLLWLFRMLLCWPLRRSLMVRVMLRKKRNLHRQKEKGGGLIKKENLKVWLVRQRSYLPNFWPVDQCSILPYIHVFMQSCIMHTIFMIIILGRLPTIFFIQTHMISSFTFHYL